MIGGQGTFILKWEIANKFGLLQDNYSCKNCWLDYWIFWDKNISYCKIFRYTQSHHPEKLSVWNGEIFVLEIRTSGSKCNQDFWVKDNTFKLYKRQDYGFLLSYLWSLISCRHFNLNQWYIFTQRGQIHITLYFSKQRISVTLLIH